MRKQSDKGICWIISPVYNDHQSALMLLEKISTLGFLVQFRIVMVDDASVEINHHYEMLKNFQPKGSITFFELIELPNNLGNQGAIATGLIQAFHRAKENDHFVVMDSDGEDSPEDIEKMYMARARNSIVVAKRARQKTNLLLMLWHVLFKTIMRSLTGKLLNFGNFSLLDYESCKRIVSNKRLSISYVGVLLQSNLNMIRLTIHRGKRYFGKSTTSKDGLLIWGFLALTVFSEKIFVKLIRLGVYFGLLCFLGILSIVFLRLFTETTVPGWSGVMVTILVSTLVQIIILLSGFIMLQTQTKLTAR